MDPNDQVVSVSSRMHLTHSVLILLTHTFHPVVSYQGRFLYFGQVGFSLPQVKCTVHTNSTQGSWKRRINPESFFDNSGVPTFVGTKLDVHTFKLCLQSEPLTRKQKKYQQSKSKKANFWLWLLSNFSIFLVQVKNWMVKKAVKLSIIFLRFDFKELSRKQVFCLL